MAMNIPRNYVYLGNSVLAQIQLVEKDYHHVFESEILKIKIEDDIVTWYIPKRVFDFNENHVYFKINLISKYSTMLTLEKDIEYFDNHAHQLKVVLAKGKNCLRSWGDKGGDFCIVNPKSNVASALSSKIDTVTNLTLTTYRRKEDEVYSRCNYTQCDGGSFSRTECDGAPAHFATFGKSSQKFRRVQFEEDEETAVETTFVFIVQ